MVNTVVRENTNFQMVQSIKGISQIICKLFYHDTCDVLSYVLTRMTGASEFTDNEGRVWIGTFNGRKAQGLTLKLS